MIRRSPLPAAPTAARFSSRPAASLLALLGLCALLLGACSGGASRDLALGEPAPAFSLAGLDGEVFSSASLAGKPAVINFWATWCQPCRREFPALNQIEAEGKARVVAIALDEEGAEVVAPFVEERGLAYTVLLGNAQIFTRYDGLAIPHTVILDAEGKVFKVYRGAVQESTLQAAVEGAAGPVT